MVTIGLDGYVRRRLRRAAHEGLVDAPDAKFRADLPLPNKRFAVIHQPFSGRRSLSRNIATTRPLHRCPGKPSPKPAGGIKRRTKTEEVIQPKRQLKRLALIIADLGLKSGRVVVRSPSDACSGRWIEALNHFR